MRAEIKIGLTVVTAILIAFTGFKILQDNPVFRPTTLLYTTFEQVDGLNKGSYIYVNGVKVGSVSSLELNPDLSVRVGLNFTELTTIPMGSKATLVDMDFLGTKAVKVQLGDGAILGYGDEISGDIEASTMDALADNGMKIVDQADPAMKELNKVLLQVNELLNESNRNEISGVLSNVQESTSHLSSMLNENRSELNKSMQHVSSILSGIDTLTTARRSELDSLIVNMERSTRTLEGMIASADSLAKTTDLLLKKMESGDGTMAKLMNDSTLYHNVSDVSYELARMLRQMNDNPKYYFKHVKIRLF